MVTLKEVCSSSAGTAGEAPVWVLAVGRPTVRVEPGMTVLEALRRAGVPPPTPRQTLRVVNGKASSEEVKDPASRTLLPGEKVTVVNRVVGGG